MLFAEKYIRQDRLQEAPEVLTIVICFYDQVVDGDILPIEGMSHSESTILIDCELTLRVGLAIDAESENLAQCSQAFIFSHFP